MITTCMAAIHRIAPNSTYEQTAREYAEGGKTTSSVVGRVLGVVAALRKDVETGYTQSLVEQVHADVFADYLEMASELQNSGYKDAAGVIAGSTLEEHLRKLATKSQVSTTSPSSGAPAKASKINGLKAASLYNQLQHRQVQAWLDVRNSAAHGEYDDYDHKQVANMIQGMGELMVRYPA